jgi:hypothetical protein
MELEKIKVKDIVPAEYNPRKISDEELSRLEDSIDEFGFVDPIIINLKNNRIVGGHQRFKIIQKEGLDELNLLRLGNVGWAFVETDLKVKDGNYEKALNIALNKISGEWDTGKLDLILDDLAVEGFDVTLTGFDVDLDSLEDLGDEDDLYDFLEEENIDDGSTEELEYSGVDTGRNTLPVLFFPLRNYIKLSNKEYYEIMEVYNKYVKENGSDKGFATYLIAGRG